MSKDLFHPALEEFAFDLPSHLIARYPAEKRDHSRLLVVYKNSGKMVDANFYDLPNFLQEGDLIIGNHTYVAKKRIYLKRKTGGRLESIFLEKQPEDRCRWKVLIKKARKLKNNEILYSEKKSAYRFRVHLEGEHVFLINLTCAEKSDFSDLNMFNEIGEVPIPPYLERDEEDLDELRYQSAYAKKNDHTGTSYSAAGPTASFHFTEELLNQLSKNNIEFESVRLEISYATFAPLRPKNFTEKRLHLEDYCIDPPVAEKLVQKKRKIALGTTSLRAVESVYRKTNGKFDHSLCGATDLFLYPPDKIDSVEGLITNFHLPSSSLLLLVGCILDRELLLDAYHHAIHNEYRFYSYGDAMLVLP